MSNFKPIGQVFLRLGGLVALILVINAGIYSLLDPPWSWGSDRIHKKRQYLMEDTSGINLLFIGDSKTGQSIIPEMFDRVVALEGGPHVRSFNFGVGSMMAPESYRTLEHLIETDQLSADYALIELSLLPMVGPRVLHSLRARYWYNPSWFVFTIGAILYSGEEAGSIAGKIKSHALSFLEQVFHLGLIKHYYGFRQGELFEYSDSFADRGYYSLERSPDLSVYADRLTFIKDTSILERSRQASLRSYSAEIPDEKVNLVHQKKLEDLIERLGRKGTKVIFLLPPHIGKRSQYLLPILQSLPRENRIDLCNPQKYPELYRADYMFEGKHMNHRGAMVFTRLLARQFCLLEKGRDSLPPGGAQIK